jgi:hypothetical protein
MTERQSPTTPSERKLIKSGHLIFSYLLTSFCFSVSPGVSFATNLRHAANAPMDLKKKKQIRLEAVKMKSKITQLELAIDGRSIFTKKTRFAATAEKNQLEKELAFSVKSL